MDWLEYGVLFAVAAVVAIALTPLARKLAIKLDAIDYPSARRVNMVLVSMPSDGLTPSSTTTALRSTIGAFCWARF